MAPSSVKFDESTKDDGRPQGSVDAAEGGGDEFDSDDEHAETALSEPIEVLFSLTFSVLIIYYSGIVIP